MSVTSGSTGWARPGRGRVAACRCDTRSWTSPAGVVGVLSAVGEIDVLTLPVLRAALDDALGRAPRHLVVDLSAVLFCSACAFDVLADGARTAAANGSGYAVAGMSPHQDRVATLVWGERGPRRYLSTAAAIIAVHDDRPA